MVIKIEPQNNLERENLTDMISKIFAIASQLPVVEQENIFPILRVLDKAVLDNAKSFIKAKLNQNFDDAVSDNIVKSIIDLRSKQALAAIFKETSVKEQSQEKPSKRLNRKIIASLIGGISIALGVTYGVANQLINDRLSQNKSVSKVESTNSREELITQITPTLNFTLTPTKTFTIEPTATPTQEIKSTSTTIPTNTSIPSSTPTEEITQIPTATITPTITNTVTPEPTETNTEIPTLTATQNPTETSTPIPTSVSTETLVTTNTIELSPTLEIPTESIEPGISDTTTPEPIQIQSNNESGEEADANLSLEWSTEYGMPGLKFVDSSSIDPELIKINNYRIENYNNHSVPSPLIMQGTTTTFGQASLSSRVIEIQSQEILRNLIPMNALIELAQPVSVSQFISDTENSFKSIRNAGYQVTREQFNILQIYFRMHDLLISQQEADSLLADSASVRERGTKREKLVLEIREKFPIVSELGLNDIYRYDSSEYSEGFMTLVLEPLGYQGIVAPKTAADLGRTFKIQIFDSINNTWIGNNSEGDILNVIALDSASNRDWPGKRERSIFSARHNPSNPQPWLCDLSVEILSQIGLNNLIGQPVTIRLVDNILTSASNKKLTISFPTNGTVSETIELIGNEVLNSPNFTFYNLNNGVNSQIYKSYFNVDKFSADLSNTINIPGRGDAYKLLIERNHVLEPMIAEGYSDLYILPGLDFGIGGINFDPIFDSNKNIVGLAGDWTLSWDNGPRQDDPEGPWRDIVLFNSQNIGIKMLPSGIEYQKVKFNFSENPLSVDHREMIAAKIDGVWRILSMRAIDSNNNLISQHRYANQDILLEIEAIDDSVENLDLTELAENTAESINDISDTFVFTFDYDLDSDGIIDSEAWISHEQYDVYKNQRRIVIDSTREIFNELYPQFGTINFEKYSQALTILNKNPEEKIGIADLKQLVVLRSNEKLMTSSTPNDYIKILIDDIFQRNVIVSPQSLLGLANIARNSNDSNSSELRRFRDPAEAYNYLERFKINQQSAQSNPTFGIDLNYDLGSFIFKISDYSQLNKLENETDEEYLTRMGVTNDLIKRTLLSKPPLITLFANNADGQGSISGLEELRKVSIVLKQISPGIMIITDFESPSVDRIKGDPNPMDLHQKGLQLEEIIQSYGKDSTEYNDFLERVYNEAKALGEVIAYKDGIGGLDAIYSPVVDSTDPQTRGSNGTVYSRNISSNPDITFAIAASFIRGMNDAGVKTVVKHAPIGVPSNIDAHSSQIIEMDFNYEQFGIWEMLAESNSLRGGVMITHTLIRPIDNLTTPNLNQNLVVGSQYRIPASINPYFVDYFKLSSDMVFSDGVSMGSFRSWLNGGSQFSGVLSGNELKTALLLHAVAGSTMLTDPNTGDDRQPEFGNFLNAVTQQLKAQGITTELFSGKGSSEYRSEMILQIVELYQKGELFNSDGTIALEKLINSDLDLSIIQSENYPNTYEVRSNYVSPDSLIYTDEDVNNFADLNLNVPAKYNAILISKLKQKYPTISLSADISNATNIDSVFDPRFDLPAESQHLRAALSMYLAGIDEIEFGINVPNQVQDEYQMIIDTITDYDFSTEFTNEELEAFINDEDKFLIAIQSEIDELITGENGIFDRESFSKELRENYNLRLVLAAIDLLQQ